MHIEGGGEFNSVLVLGGAGFIGGHFLNKLAATSWRAIVVTRHYEKAKHLLELPPVDDIVEADIYDDAALDRLVQGHDAVLNLVGILHSRKGEPYGPEFAKTHVDLPRRIAQACAAHGVSRLLHVSALGVSSEAPSMYLRSKADGELAAKSQQPRVNATLFRPSVVFGEGDNFLNMFASLEKFLPVVPLAAADAKFQPIHVEDVAQALVNALNNERTIGKTYELAGPKVYTLRELVRLAGEYSGHRRPIISLPESLSRLQAMVLEHLPGEPLMTRDNLASMSVDNVASAPPDPELGIAPVALESIAPAYLSGQATNPSARRDAQSASTH